jgi:hypothetical protein
VYLSGVALMERDANIQRKAVALSPIRRGDAVRSLVVDGLSADVR